MSSSLATRLDASKIDEQGYCPLFTVIPADIRNTIFTLALTAYDDLSKPYAKESFYYRPGFRFQRRIDTNLLLTCRRIYLETHLTPVAINEHFFWGSPDRGPPNKRYAGNPRLYFELLTKEQMAAVRTVHFFTQQYWLEGSWADVSRLPHLQTVKKVKITLRHTDWWFWEYGEKLGIDPRFEGRTGDLKMGQNSGKMDFEAKAWGNQFRNLNSLTELEIVFETVERCIPQLDKIAAFALTWKFPLQNGMHLSTESTGGIVKDDWAGSDWLNDDVPEQDWFDDDVPEQQMEEVAFVEPVNNYYVLSLKWRAREIDSVSSKLKEKQAGQ